MARLTKQEKIELLREDLINKQLSYSGKTFKEVVHDKEWFRNNTITKDQYDSFKKYSLKKIKKTLKCNNERAEKEFLWFDMSFGLKIKN